MSRFALILTIIVGSVSFAAASVSMAHAQDSTAATPIPKHHRTHRRAHPVRAASGIVRHPVNTASKVIHHPVHETTEVFHEATGTEPVRPKPAPAN